jgi:hypothetical protein
MTITAIAGSVLLLGVEASLRTTDEAMEEMVAIGIAQQLMDETLGMRYMEAGEDPEGTLGAASAEAAGNGRELFDDTDDFEEFSAQPVQDTWGVTLGTGDGSGGTRHEKFQISRNKLSGWRELISVYYVDESDPQVRLTAGETSKMRCIDIQIFRQNADNTEREVARLKRVYAYVPPPQ